MKSKVVEALDPGRVKRQDWDTGGGDRLLVPYFIADDEAGELDFGPMRRGYCAWLAARIFHQDAELWRRTGRDRSGDGRWAMR